ncbi:MAG: transglycosylase domain-containing protein, partial [Candidatus Binataceae bacterium]
MSVRRLLKIALFAGIAVALFVVPPGAYFFIKYYRALDQEVAARFAGKRWNLPSRIYSDSLNVYPGQNLKDLGFYERLARLNYHRVDPGKVTARGHYSLDVKAGRLDLFLHSFAYPYRRSGGELVEIDLTKDETIGAMKEPGTAHVIDSIELEPELISGIFEGIWEQRHLVRLSQIPPALLDAILAAEDHRFYQHGGIDPVRITKALWIDVWSGSWRQGGSTLTQQLMKNFFLTRQRSWKRKVKEALMSLIAERRFTKEEILENYINDIYLGQRGQEGIFGVWEASEYYFTKEPRDLTIGEMATIAGIIRSPNRLNPLRHPDRAQARRDEVLALMIEHGYISKAAYDQAVSEPLISREVYTETNDAPFFVDYVKKELAERYPPDVLTAEGLRIFTTLDVHLEKLAEQSIRENLAALEAKYSNLRRRTERERLESCLVALEPQTGRIRAMAGGRNYQGSQFNRVVQSKRQPGSLFKPVTYLAALEASLDASDVKFTPTSTIEDLPFTWNYATDMSWTPNNYKDKYFGRVTLEVALGKSLNSATSRLAYAVGLD